MIDGNNYWKENKSDGIGISYPVRQVSQTDVCIYSTRLCECDTRSIFKQSFAGLNSEFSFSLTG